MKQVAPPRWSEEQLERDIAVAKQQFREMRMQEPLEQYLELFDEYSDAVATLIEGTIDLTELSEQAVEYLTDPNTLMAVRYLASPPISEDDLKVLTDASLAPGPLRKNPEMAKRIVDTVLLGLDRNRFPWVSEDREPTDAEREVARTSTAALIAAQRVQTARRTEAKDTQEEAVAECLKTNGFQEVPRRPVQNTMDFPNVGEFYRETSFGSRKADLIVRLWDGRAMPLECKVSNSSTNSVKRVNNDAAVKAKIWVQEFGTASAVPAAVLSGVFKVHNLVAAQEDKLTLFWAHDLDAMVTFIDSTRPEGSSPTLFS